MLQSPLFVAPGYRSFVRYKTFIPTSAYYDYTLDEENATAAYYDNEEDYRTFHYLGNQMKVKRQQAEAA